MYLSERQARRFAKAKTLDDGRLYDVRPYDSAHPEGSWLVILGDTVVTPTPIERAMAGV